jgi:hypothetical protein
MVRRLVAFSSTTRRPASYAAPTLAQGVGEPRRTLAIKNTLPEAAEAELRNIHNTKIEIEERLAELESRASLVTKSLNAEGRTHRPIDSEALRSLEETLSRPALTRALPVIALDQAWQWIGNSLGMIIDLKNAGWSHSERDS